MSFAQHSGPQGDDRDLLTAGIGVLTDSAVLDIGFSFIGRDEPAATSAKSASAFTVIDSSEAHPAGSYSNMSLLEEELRDRLQDQTAALENKTRMPQQEGSIIGSDYSYDSLHSLASELTEAIELIEQVKTTGAKLRGLDDTEAKRTICTQLGGCKRICKGSIMLETAVPPDTARLLWEWYGNSWRCDDKELNNLYDELIAALGGDLVAIGSIYFSSDGQVPIQIPSGSSPPPFEPERIIFLPEDPSVPSRREASYIEMVAERLGKKMDETREVHAQTPGCVDLCLYFDIDAEVRGALNALPASPAQPAQPVQPVQPAPRRPRRPRRRPRRPRRLRHPCHPHRSRCRHDFSASFCMSCAAADRRAW